MDLYTLSDQYHITSLQLRERIAQLRAQLPYAPSGQAFLLKQRIELLCRELRDLKTVSAYLKNYYVS